MFQLIISEYLIKILFGDNIIFQAQLKLHKFFSFHFMSKLTGNLIWENISYTVKLSNGQERRVLHRHSGEVTNGNLGIDTKYFFSESSDILGFIVAILGNRRNFT
jgi:hypothetical protein